MKTDSIKIELLESALFPSRIKEFVQDKNPIFHLGDYSLIDSPTIGIVGSRRCTRYGMTVAKEIAKRAAMRGITVVSGLAKGIDSIAHRSVMEHGGKTIGVVAGGIDVIYPKENMDLYERIAEEGLLISEYPPGSPVFKWNFPIRNRLISALSDVLVVVEAGTRSGSLITAECAIEQGKDVFAVPGNITNAYSMGPNKLIRDGARALVVIDDVFSSINDIYGWVYSDNDKGHKNGVLHESINRSNKASIESLSIMENSIIKGLGRDEKKVFDIVFGMGEVPISEIYQRIAKDVEIYPPLGIPEINGIISILEMKGLLYCEMGKVMVANFT